MAIARVASQIAGAVADNTTSVSRAYPGNVTSGNLLVIGVTKYSPSNDAFVAGDISKSAGTATVGTFTLDASVNYNYSAGDYVAAAVYSAPVTGSGSCTIQVAGAVANSYLFIGVQEYSGADVTGTRVAGASTGQAATGAPTTGTVVSGGAGAFVGALGTVTSGATTHTVGADYTQIAEEENGASHMTGSIEDRLVAVDTTDAADWTAPTTVPYACCVACYKEAAAAGGLAIPVLTRQYRARWS